MPDQPIPPKRTRALPRVWQRFLYLEIGDQFFIGRCCYVKTGFFRAHVVVNGSRFITLPPWRKVLVVPIRPTEFQQQVAKALAKSSPFADLLERKPFPPNQGQTHFFGDDCEGGHGDRPVNNDNNVSGPTS